MLLFTPVRSASEAERSRRFLEKNSVGGLLPAMLFPRSLPPCISHGGSDAADAGCLRPCPM